MPIILGVEGQAKELMEEYDAAIYFEPENGKEFMEAINKISRDKDLYELLSKNALNPAKDYDRKQLAENMLTQIKSLI